VSLLDRYLAKEILLPFGAGLVFLTQILLATQILAQATVLFGSGVAAWDVLRVVLLLTPHLLGFILPVAFLLGAVIGLGRLAEDREIIAIGAAGISPVRLVRVPLLIGVLAAVALSAGGDDTASTTTTALGATLERAAPGRDRLRSALEFMVPLTGERSYPAVWLSLWSGAMHNPALAGVHRRYYRRWRSILSRCVAESVRRKQARAPRDARDAIDLLAAGVDGLWLAVTFEGRRFSVARRRRLVTSLVDSVLGLERGVH